MSFRKTEANMLMRVLWRLQQFHVPAKAICEVMGMSQPNLSYWTGMYRCIVFQGRIGITRQEFYLKSTLLPRA